MIIRRAAVLALVLAAVSSGTACISLPKLTAGSDLEAARVERATRVNPGNVHAWFIRGKIALDESDYGHAEKYFRRTLELAPDFEEAWVGLGVARMELGRWKGAVEAYARLHELQPKSVAAMEGLATAHFGAGDRAEARRWAQQALLVAPNARQAHRILGEVAYIDGDYRAAERHWARAVADGAMAGPLGAMLTDLRQYLEKYEGVAATGS